MLAECTGYDRSVAPNSVAQGEYAGRLAIRAYTARAARVPATFAVPISRIGPIPHRRSYSA